jgi:RNA polymerase sigma-70 factor, ECF subfamily
LEGDRDGERLVSFQRWTDYLSSAADCFKCAIPMVSDPSQEQTDREMLALVAREDQQAFSRLYDRLSGPLYSVALRMLGDAAEAQDALQDVFLQLWRRAGSYDVDQSSVFSWAILMTRSRVIDRLRARGRRLRVVSSSTDDDASKVAMAHASTIESAADTADRNEEAVRVRSSLSKLPAEQREAIEMAFFNDLTHHEIAAALGQPLGTIKARIRRGLLKLRERVTI